MFAAGGTGAAAAEEAADEGGSEEHDASNEDAKALLKARRNLVVANNTALYLLGFRAGLGESGLAHCGPIDPTHEALVHILGVKACKESFRCDALLHQAVFCLLYAFVALEVPSNEAATACEDEEEPPEVCALVGTGRAAVVAGHGVVTEV
eukprot:CAMPEP_0117665796 /NCGR_PEP_ID=MMETSP0804-20121206/10014_1 /TAXON_ID=1074897 /ORGANISM="Tetraselmis astigmatica, Strain CCMP880" /LENGTH=150 /DNA_ID=CAMNT_0005473259 /DNA_START=246 /DNA_END=698 /DNA_ORIENTATION=-